MCHNAQRLPSRLFVELYRGPYMLKLRLQLCFIVYTQPVTGLFRGFGSNTNFGHNT